MKKNITVISILGLLIIVFLIIVILRFVNKNNMSELYEKYQYPNEDFFGKELYSEIDYECSDYESQIGNAIVSKAMFVSEYLGKREDSEDSLGDVGALDSYYYYNRKEATSQNVTFEFITCKITEDKGHIWVITQRVYYDANEAMLSGTGKVLSLWSIENKEGEWYVVQIQEAP